MLQARIKLAEEYVRFRQTVAYRALISDTAVFCESLTYWQKADARAFLQTYVPTNSEAQQIVAECRRVL